MKYRNISVPKALADVIEEFIENNPQYGYTSIAGFLTDLARNRLKELGALQKGRAIEQEKGEERFPSDESKCIKYCRYAKRNSQGQLICSQYFDLEPRPSDCEQEGKFALR